MAPAIGAQPAGGVRVGATPTAAPAAEAAPPQPNSAGGQLDAVMRNLDALRPESGTRRLYSAHVGRALGLDGGELARFRRAFHTAEIDADGHFRVNMRRPYTMPMPGDLSLELDHPVVGHIDGDTLRLREGLSAQGYSIPSVIRQRSTQTIFVQATVFGSETNVAQLSY